MPDNHDILSYFKKYEKGDSAFYYIYYTESPFSYFLK